MFVYLGLGSNQGDRVAHLHEAIARLALNVQRIRESAMYESAPMYVTDQPPFLNMAVCGETPLSPLDLLKFLKRIEAEMGRNLGQNAQRYGPRPIDIDIVLATTTANPQQPGDYVVMDTPELIIPHANLAERAFVLLPLRDLAPQMMHPILHQSITELAEAVATQEIHRLDNSHE